MDREERLTFKSIFLVLVIILMVLPFFTAFSEVLAGFLQKTPIYLLIQNYIVPIETRIVGTILGLLGVPTTILRDSLAVKGRILTVTWNCLGWQSVLFLLATFLTGLQGNFKFSSKMEAVLIGILGTFWVNISRLVFIAVLGAYFPSIYPIVFHDYLATFVAIGWILFFWWFVYTFILEERISLAP